VRREAREAVEQVHDLADRCVCLLHEAIDFDLRAVVRLAPLPVLRRLGQLGDHPRALRPRQTPLAGRSQHDGRDAVPARPFHRPRLHQHGDLLADTTRSGRLLAHAEVAVQRRHHDAAPVVVAVPFGPIERGQHERVGNYFGAAHRRFLLSSEAPGDGF
jgi:hypothetical protein